MWKRNDESGTWSSTEVAESGQQAPLQNTTPDASKHSNAHQFLEDDLSSIPDQEVTKSVSVFAHAARAKYNFFE